jgi:hypothetical protein
MLILLRTGTLVGRSFAGTRGGEVLKGAFRVGLDGFGTGLPAGRADLTVLVLQIGSQCE